MTARRRPARRIPRTCLPLEPLEAEIARLTRRRGIAESTLLGNALYHNLKRARARRWPTRLIPIEQAESICWHLDVYPDVLYGAAWHRAVDRAAARADELAARKAARRPARCTAASPVIASATAAPATAATTTRGKAA